jgi:hypothetical protein
MNNNDLDTIETLFMRNDTLTLYGIPYKMRSNIGQEPRHLYEAGNTKNWIYFGEPGWFGSMSQERMEAVKTFREKYEDQLPQNPNEWCYLER